MHQKADQAIFQGPIHSRVCIALAPADLFEVHAPVCMYGEDQDRIRVYHEIAIAAVTAALLGLALGP